MGDRSIIDATTRCCIEHQNDAAFAAWKASEAVIRSDHVAAIAYQAAAARHAHEAHIRLDQFMLIRFKHTAAETY